MTNSHIAEVLANCALRFNDEDLKETTVKFINKFVQMMFFEKKDRTKDVNRPNCFEHYHPYNGRACLYRGVDDYQHSWINDLIIKYVAGVCIKNDGEVYLNPLEFGLDYLELKDLHIRDKAYRIKYDKKSKSWDVQSG
jgi:hypothetical protein